MRTARASGSQKRHQSGLARSRQSAIVRSGPARARRQTPSHSPKRVPGTRRAGSAIQNGIRPRFGRTTQRSPLERSRNGKLASGGPSRLSLAPIAAALGVDAESAQGEAAKAQLRTNTDAAIAAGVHGVPTLAFDGNLFWGNDAHGFAIAALRNPDVLADPEMQRLSALPVGIRRG